MSGPRLGDEIPMYLTLTAGYEILSLKGEKKTRHLASRNSGRRFQSEVVKKNVTCIACSSFALHASHCCIMQGVGRDVYQSYRLLRGPKPGSIGGRTSVPRISKFSAARVGNSAFHRVAKLASLRPLSVFHERRYV